MTGWAQRLGRIGKVHSFDYPYMAEGRRSPDRLPRLVDAHREALRAARARHRGPVFLAGKSMGSRVGCHVSLEEEVDGVICFGYPLVGMSKASPVRDKVLLDLRTPILFIQGTRDRLCPLERLEGVLRRMKARHTLHVVESGNHSLKVTRSWCKAHEATQSDVDDAVTKRIALFVGEP